MTNEMSIDYEVIQELFNKSDVERQKVYEAIDKIRNEIHWATVQSNMWRGADADEFREAMTQRLAETYSVMKWINAITWELKNYAEQLKEQENARAQKISSSVEM